jgi:hypothetical protein
MNLRAILFATLLPVAAWAADAPPIATPPPAPPPSDCCVLILRSVVAPIEQVIQHPHQYDFGETLAILQQFDACVADNPIKGVVRHTGQDQCPDVTDALAAQTAALAVSKKAPPPTTQGSPP